MRSPISFLTKDLSQSRIDVECKKQLTISCATSGLKEKNLETQPFTHLVHMSSWESEQLTGEPRAVHRNAEDDSTS